MNPELPDPYGLLDKANLAIQISERISQRGLGKAQAANLLGISQSELVAMLDGDFIQYPIETMMGYLDALEPDEPMFED